MNKCKCGKPLNSLAISESQQQSVKQARGQYGNVCMYCMLKNVVTR